MRASRPMGWVARCGGLVGILLLVACQEEEHPDYYQAPGGADAEGGAGASADAGGGGGGPGENQAPGAEEPVGVFYVIGAAGDSRPSEDRLCSNLGELIVELGEPRVSLAKIAPQSGDIYYLQGGYVGGNYQTCDEAEADCQDGIVLRRSAEGSLLKAPEGQCDEVLAFSLDPTDGSVHMTCDSSLLVWRDESGDPAPCAWAIDLLGNSLCDSFVTAADGEVHELSRAITFREDYLKGVMLNFSMAHPEGGFWVADRKEGIRYRITPDGQVEEDGSYLELAGGGLGRVIGMGEYGQLYSFDGGSIHSLFTDRPSERVYLSNAGDCRAPGDDLILALPVAPALSPLDAP